MSDSRKDGCPTCGSHTRDAGEAYDEAVAAETELAISEGIGNPGLVELCTDPWHEDRPDA